MLAAPHGRDGQLDDVLAAVGELQERIATGPDPKLVEQVAALSARVDQLVAGGAPLSESGDGSGEAAAGPTPATLERDVEYVLMAIERLSVHLGPTSAR